MQTDVKYTKKLEYRTFYADESISFLNLRFENDVNMYGTQAAIVFDAARVQFENDVNMYGTQAFRVKDMLAKCLRMM